MTNKDHNRLLSDIINTEGLEYAMYTIENRAIPSMIDGLKPVQRFFLYSALQTAKDKFNKVASIGGRVSEWGYHHGEQSACEAGILMAADYCNNITLLTGDGAFGSRFIRKAAAARYIFAKISDNFNKIYKDIDISPAHEDPEHIPPKYYLPLIPFVLINGVKGIATGFATQILPHDYQSVADKVKEYLETGNIKENPLVKYYDFKGTIEPYSKIVNQKLIKGVTLTGLYKLSGFTLTISELPFNTEREDYIALLDKLEESGKIVSYTEEISSERVHIVVKLKRDFLTTDTEKNHQLILKEFKLQESIAQNITVLDENNKLKVYDEPKELIKDFVDFRLTYFDKRIQNNIKKETDKFNLATAKIIFIKKVINKEIVLDKLSRKESIKLIESYNELKDYSEELINMKLYHLTTDEVKKLEQQQEELKKSLDYWKTTTAKTEYLKDLQNK